ncbi:MAG TPA: cell division protein ZapE [Firmicutes bacterium]|nr:cell division protein ZapE [Bacillota bacterium]
MGKNAPQIGCERCRPYYGQGYRLEKNVDRENPYPRVVPCECARSLCVCGALRDARNVEGPNYTELSERAADAVSELDCPCWPIRQKIDRINRLLLASKVDHVGIMLSDVQTKVNGRALQETQFAVGAASSFIEHAAKGEKQKGLYIYGKTGGGKTYLASALLNELIIRTARPGLFVNVTQQLFPRLRQTYEDENRSETEMQIMSQLSRMPYLVLDDLGVERNTKWESEVLYNIIDVRYRRRKEVIITSNVSPDEFESLSRGRITSRLKHMCVVIKMPDEDLRQYFDYVVR